VIKIKEITPEIFHLKFQSSNLLALHLLRFSDYYEHIDEKLYRKKFSMSDSLEIAFKQDKDALENADGINLPVSIIYKMAKEYNTALTIQERFILSTIETIKCNQPALKYIIATYGNEDDADAFYHELAHGFYYTNEAYKLKMNALISVLPKRVKEEMYGYLTRLNYNPSVHNDEFQAYMATGLVGEEKEVLNERLLHMFRAKFFDLFLTTLSECNIN
jgi:hypothetical protein